MRVRTFLLYLIGNRQAILDLAADRRAIWVGLVFVFSAALARDYDGVDLLHEPWHLLIPLGASLAASFLLFLVACGPVFRRREVRPAFFGAYRSFLTLFWMTAPLAWVYAIPYERMLSPGSATSANLWTLALVAAWRVALMVRVVSVITNQRTISSMVLVLACADAVALAAIYFMPKPVISFMGGVRLSESEQVIASTTLLVGCLGIVSAPVLGLAGLLAFFAGKPAWQVPAADPDMRPSGRGMWILAALSVAVWLPVLPWTQGEQHLRWNVDRDMKKGRIAEALDLMSAHDLSDFPPHWDPSPRVGYRGEVPHIFDVMDVLVTRDCAPWVRALFVDKLRRQFGQQYDSGFHYLSGPELARVVRILQQLPEGPEIAAEHFGDVEARLSREGPDAPDHENLVALKNLAAKNKTGSNP